MLSNLITLVNGRSPQGFGYSSTADEVTAGIDLSGRTYLVTGCNSGLGLETCRVLASRGAQLIGAARTEAKGAEALSACPGSHSAVACDLSEPESVRGAVEALADTRIDGIIANAGIMALPERTVSHGVELQLLTNHVGHFLLVTGLLDRLTPSGRVVMLSSTAHFNTYREGIRFDDLDASAHYTPWGAYGQSKLANLLFAKELAKRLPEGQTANSVHPGVIWTNLGRHIPGWTQRLASAVAPVVLKTIPQGAATQCFVAVHPDAAHVTGEYWKDSQVAKASAHGRNDAMATELWERTEAIVRGL